MVRTEEELITAVLTGGVGVVLVTLGLVLLLTLVAFVLTAFL